MAAKNLHCPIEAPPAASRVQGNVNFLSSPSISKAEAMEILTSPTIMADFFRKRLPNISRKGSILKECKPHVLRDRERGRQVLSYQLTFSHPSVRKIVPKTLVAKRFVDRSKGRHEYSALRMLWGKGFDHKSDLRVPRAFSFFEELGLLIQERASGALLRRTLNRDSLIASAGMKAAARWLIKLHHIAADHEGIGQHADDETSIEGCLHRIGSRKPQLLPQLEDLESLIKAKLSSFSPIRFTLVHGDFQCDNIFVSKEKVTVVDFGRFCKSDPARDLGCMIAQTRTTGALESTSLPPALPRLQAFWEEYLAAVAVEEREGLSERTCTYAALKYLENVDYISSFSPEGREDVFQLLLNDAMRFAKAGRTEEIL